MEQEARAVNQNHAFRIQCYFSETVVRKLKLIWQVLWKKLLGDDNFS